MVRVVLDKVKQRLFLKKVCWELGLNSDQVGELIGITGRSFRDWISGKTLPKKEALKRLSNVTGVGLPNIIEEREEWWSGRVNGPRGAKKSLELYGVTLTSADRAKGGRNSQRVRRENPEYYRGLGCKVANEFEVPDYSDKLAEWVGIVLGDGCLTRGQCEVSLHIRDDAEYSKYVADLVRGLFGCSPSILIYQKQNLRRVCISGVKFVEILQSFGLKVGDKMKNKIDIPGWIKDDPQYLRVCMRGLFDTDGGTFTHNHTVNGYRYLHFGLTLTSGSSSLLASYRKGLEDNGFSTYSSGMSVFVYGERASKRFFEIFRPNNPKHKGRFAKYLSGRKKLGKLK